MTTIATPPICLLADDDETIRAFICLALQRLGFSVIQCANGAGAIEQMHIITKFDLIVTDLVMPEVDGFGVVRAARVRGLKVPIIVLTAHKERAVGIIALGAQVVLEKPIRYEALKQAVHTLLPQMNGAQGKK